MCNYYEYRMYFVCNKYSWYVRQFLLYVLYIEGSILNRPTWNANRVKNCQVDMFQLGSHIESAYGD